CLKRQERSVQCASGRSGMLAIASVIADSGAARTGKPQRSENMRSRPLRNHHGSHQCRKQCSLRATESTVESTTKIRYMTRGCAAGRAAASLAELADLAN